MIYGLLVLYAAFGVGLAVGSEVTATKGGRRSPGTELLARVVIAIAYPVLYGWMGAERLKRRWNRGER